MDESPNRQSPTNQNSSPSRTINGRSSNNSNHMNHQTTSNNSSNHQTNNGTGSPHSPLSNDSMLTGGGNYDNMNCENLRNMMGSSALDGALLNGGNSGNGINDIMLGGGLGSDSSSKLITSSSASLQTSLMMSQTSPSHHLNNTQTTTSIPEIVFSGEIYYIQLPFEDKLTIFFRRLLWIRVRSRLSHGWQFPWARHNGASDVWECQYHWPNNWR